MKIPHTFAWWIAGLGALPLDAAAPKEPAPVFLHLPRLVTTSSSKEPRLRPAKFTADRLLPAGAVGAVSAVKGGAKILALEPGKAWSRRLRGGARDVTFVSFLAYGSEGTTFQMGGASLAIKPGAKPGYADIAVVNTGAVSTGGGQLNYSVKIELYDGVSLAALPVLTVRVDPAAGVWDLYVFQRLLAANLPLTNVAGSREFRIEAGHGGAWLCGLVLCDENPLYPDANLNGIDDGFETETRGALLAADAPAADRQQLLAQWRESQQAAQPKAWTLRRPPPDGTAGAQ